MIEILKELQLKYDELLATQQLTEAYLLDAVFHLAELSTNSSRELLKQTLSTPNGKTDDENIDLIKTTIKSIQNQKDKIYEKYGISRHSQGTI